MFNVGSLDLTGSPDEVTARIQAAIDAAANRETVFFPAGRYVLRRLMLPSGTTIEGEGQNTILFLADGTHSSLLESLPDDENPNIPRADLRLPDYDNANYGCHDIVIRNLLLDGNSENQSLTTACEPNAERWRWADREGQVCYADDNIAHGICLIGVDRALIESVTAQNFRLDGIYLGKYARRNTYRPGCRDVGVTRCRLLRNLRAGLSVTRGIDINIHDNFFRGNNRGGERRIYRSAALDLEPNTNDTVRRVRVSGNIIETEFADGIGVIGGKAGPTTLSDITIVSNTVHEPDVPGRDPAVGIVVSGTGKRVTVASNVIDGVHQGIWVGNWSASRDFPSDVMIVANVVAGLRREATVGINVHSGAKRVVALGNHVSGYPDRVSASTPPGATEHHQRTDSVLIGANALESAGDRPAEINMLRLTNAVLLANLADPHASPGIEVEELRAGSETFLPHGLAVNGSARPLDSVIRDFNSQRYEATWGQLEVVGAGPDGQNLEYELRGVTRLQPGRSARLHDRGHDALPFYAASTGDLVWAAFSAPLAVGLTPVAQVVRDQHIRVELINTSSGAVDLPKGRVLVSVLQVRDRASP